MEKKIRSFGPHKKKNNGWGFWEYYFGIGFVIFGVAYFEFLVAGNLWWMFALFISALMAALLDREIKIRTGVFKIGNRQD